MLVVGGQAGAGAGFNVVPGSAWFSVDRRFNPEEELDEARATDGDHRGSGRRRRRRHRGAAGAAVRRHGPGPPRGPGAGALRRGRRRAGLPAVPGVLDTRWYSQLGIPAFGYGGGLDVAHGPHEYIDEAAMRRCAVYALFAARSAPDDRYTIGRCAGCSRTSDRSRSRTCCSRPTARSSASPTARG